MTQIIELIDKDIKTAITMCYIFKKLKEGLIILRKGIKDLKNTQIEILEIETIR